MSRPSPTGSSQAEAGSSTGCTARSPARSASVCPDIKPGLEPHTLSSSRLLVLDDLPLPPQLSHQLLFSRQVELVARRKDLTHALAQRVAHHRIILIGAEDETYRRAFISTHLLRLVVAGV